MNYITDTTDITDITDIINNLNKYMMTEKNIHKYSKKFYNKKKIINKKIINNDLINKDILIPEYNDSLFWCFYIIDKGMNNYFLINNNNYLIEKQYKINIAEKLNTYKTEIKIYKLNKTNIESVLINDECINYECIHYLCIILKKSIIILDNYIYYEFLYNEDNPYIIIKKNNKYCLYINDNKDNYKKYLDEISSTKWKVENYKKPLKSISSYTIKDLIDICNKLNISLLKDNKKKLKKDLYEDILIKLY